MAKNIRDAVREICLSLPESDEVVSRGNPNFRVNKKTFAIFVVNHHGDGRIGLWLNSPPGDQEYYAQNEPQHFYVPPYVGPAGWLGMELNKDLSWVTAAKLIQRAYAYKAPKKLLSDLGPPLEIKPPTESLPIAELDPFAMPIPAQHLQDIADYCLSLPETQQGDQFGAPCFRAGKKNFCTLHFRSGRLKLSTWVGVEHQATYTFDPRFSIPKYTGVNGWIELDIHEAMDLDEIEALIRQSYRHFALKRMLKRLDPDHI